MVYMFNDMHVDSPVPTNSKKSNMIGHFAWNPESTTPSLDSDERNLQQNPYLNKYTPKSNIDSKNDGLEDVSFK